MLRQTATDEVHAVAAMLTWSLHATSKSVTHLGLHDGDGAELLAALAVLGWSVRPDADVLIVPAGEGVIGPDRPVVVVVLHPETAGERPWPGWDALVPRNGYQGCGRAGRWTWYVRDDQAATLGPLLGSLPVTGPDLVEELITWRTAALTRWAARADEESGRPNKELRAELQASRELLAAIQNSFSWRITAPLRGVRALRPPRAVRR